jgi:hypothetical protein
MLYKVSSAWNVHIRYDRHQKAESQECDDQPRAV